MNFATLKDLRKVYGCFQEKQYWFPHIRQDQIERRISDGECVYQDGVVITFQIYKKTVKIGDVSIPRGSVMLHQILNSKQGNGNAGKVFEQFVKEVCSSDFSSADLYLAVRANNTRAREFYVRHKMKAVGKVNWCKGSMPGVVYRRVI